MQLSAVGWGIPRNANSGAAISALVARLRANEDLARRPGYSKAGPSRATSWGYSAPPQPAPRPSPATPPAHSPWAPPPGVPIRDLVPTLPTQQPAVGVLKQTEPVSSTKPFYPQGGCHYPYECAVPSTNQHVPVDPSLLKQIKPVSTTTPYFPPAGPITPSDQPPSFTDQITAGGGTPNPSTTPASSSATSVSTPPWPWIVGGLALLLLMR